MLFVYGGADDMLIPHDSGEGGYQVEPRVAYELLVEEGVAHDDALLMDLSQAWHGQGWVRRDVWWLSEGEALAFGWARFSEIVLTDRRYWFHLADPDPCEPSAVPPGEMLPSVGGAIKTAALLHRLAVGERLSRAQTHQPGELLEGAERLGSPLARLAASNRMSAAGISIFYGAQDDDTAIAEVRNAEIDPARSEVTVGAFATTRELLLVDLAEVPAFSGIFDEERGHTGPALQFLTSFADQVSGPVQRDGRDHVEYAPTQVFAEWLRFEFRPGARRVDGVRYRSAQGPGVCVALFFGHGSAADSGATASEDQPLQLLVP